MADKTDKAEVNAVINELLKMMVSAKPALKKGKQSSGGAIMELGGGDEDASSSDSDTSDSDTSDSEASNLEASNLEASFLKLGEADSDTEKPTSDAKDEPQGEDVMTGGFIMLG